MKHTFFPGTADTEKYLSRDLSWLDFNSRVLDEAECPANPLMERLRFIAITSGNLDEFFMVRIAGLRRLLHEGSAWHDPAGLDVNEQLLGTREKIDRMLKRQRNLLQGILKELESYGVFIVKAAELSQQEREELKAYFLSEIMPALTPLAVNPGQAFPLLNSGAIEIAVKFIPSGHAESAFAFVEVPGVLERFIALPGQKGRFILLEELILSYLPPLFAGGTILEAFPFRITRDMDIAMGDRNTGDLRSYIGRKLLQRSHREVIRLEMPEGISGELAQWLRKNFNLEPLFEYFCCGPLYLKQFSELIPKAALPRLSEPPWPPVMPPEFAQEHSVFAVIRKYEELLIALPYHSFVPVLKLLEEAAADPDVLAIKQTLYRVGGNSPVVRALQHAAEAGKQVTVVLELRARFDESNNIAWAQALDESGAHVVYGIPGLKVHAKALLIIRKEEGGIRRYCHVATGNYNDNTASAYTDMGMMSCDPELCSDVAEMFNILTGGGAPPEHFRKITLAPFALRTTLAVLIQNEIAAVRAGNKGEIIAKMNSFSDPEMVELVHRAADAGVEITLIVRGICCYRPRPGQKNCRIISIVDRYLEHSRIFFFRNQGKPLWFLSSADWMSRNLDRRVELMFPVTSPRLRKMLEELLRFQMEDADKARCLQPSGTYSPMPLLTQYTEKRSQAASWLYFKTNAEETLKSFRLNQ